MKTEWIPVFCQRPTGYVRIMPFMLLLVVITACSHNPQSGAGAQKRMKLIIGEINEISLPRPTDSLVLLTGTSDNSEVVDVSQKPSVGTGSAASNPSVFLIKGVTLGTARVVFTEKRTGDAGAGQVRKTYLVQVVSK